jgi:hypothetical protein
LLIQRSKGPAALDAISNRLKTEAAMMESGSETPPAIVRLILIPSLITVALTILRMAGELEGLSKTFFNAEPGGFLAIIGIVWLVPIFGIYFALKLSGAGQGPASGGRAIGIAVLGFIFLAAGYSILNYYQSSFAGLIVMWAMAVAGAAIQAAAWPRLFRVLIAYGYAARIPVAIVMFVATENGWHSHYSALAVPATEMSTLEQYLLFGLIPQLVWWVSFTIIVGSLFGSGAAVFAGRGKRPAPSFAS